ncbi:hypothetical protein [Lysinibacillus sp. SGAir0095]|uniref:hypothetical protein n=1 Tax=Lysinibacillus sp. SGAir0095 TaxID=2070463 RepID=UPI0010CCC790|nr:hypothetical protein [Lysinibacillus sp. SGAir0095]QCR31500.1 hypothetical protein C1N55_04655 [Lysinibacillus sp. SGAir0095]
MIQEVHEVVESFNNYTNNISNGCFQIADFLRKDNIAEAMHLILQFSEGMGWIVQASELLSKNGVEVFFEVEKIHEFLNEINNGLEIQDYVIVADMFEYEIAPFFEKVNRIEGFDN